MGCWGGYEKPRGASQLLGEGYVWYNSILASVDGDAYLLFLGAVGEGGHQLPHGLATVGQAAGGGLAAYQDAAGGVGGGVAGVDADALEVGDILDERQGAFEPGGVGQHHRIGARGDGGLTIKLLLRTHGDGVEVAVGGFQGVAESHSVDGEATHRIAVASLGAL